MSCFCYLIMIIKRASARMILSCLRRNPQLIAFFLPHLQQKDLLGGSGVLKIATDVFFKEFAGSFFSASRFALHTSRSTACLIESSMQETIERYRSYNRDTLTGSTSVEHNLQHLKQEAASMMKKIELLEVSKRKLLGEGLGSCSLEELQQMEQQLQKSVINIRARKTQVFKEQTKQLKEKFGMKDRLEYIPSSDVETALFIGLPETRTKRLPPPSQV